MYKNRYLNQMLACLLLAAVLLIVPKQAYGLDMLHSTPYAAADIFSDLLHWLINAICQPVWGAIMTGLKANFEIATPTSDFLKNLSQILGQNNSLWKTATDVCTTIVRPIAGGVLGFCVMVQFIKISQKIDGSQTVPALKEIVFLVAFYVFFSWLITHSTEILTAVYDVILKSSTKMTELQHNFNYMDNFKTVEFTDIGWAIVSIAFAFILVMLTFLTTAYAHALLIMRGIQLYIYIMFAPLSLALLGSEQTRSMGIGFIKAFVSQCLAGMILVFLVYSYPAIISMVVIVPQLGIQHALSACLAVVLAYFMALKKSSDIANAILGS